MLGRKIVYDLSNLVYNDIIQNSCITKLQLFTSVLFDILGYVLSQNFYWSAILGVPPIPQLFNLWNVDQATVHFYTVDSIS